VIKSPRGKTTNDPKEIRLEIRLTNDRQEKLDYCVDAEGLSRAEIIRRGIDKMYAETISKLSPSKLDLILRGIESGIFSNEQEKDE
jgi:hypothetical protein